MTSFDTVLDRALSTIRDYKIDKLRAADKKNGTNYTQPYLDKYLIKAIPEFGYCLQSLDYDENTRQLVSSLTNKEINILADWWILSWFENEVQDVTQFNIHMQETDMRHMSEASNLDSKQKYLIYLREIVQKDTNLYLTNSMESFLGGIND